MDLEKNNALNGRQKEEYNKLTNDFNGLQVEKSDDNFKISTLHLRTCMTRQLLSLPRQRRWRESWRKTLNDLSLISKCAARGLTNARWASSYKKTLFTVQPFAETNTLLGSLLQLSYQGIFVYSTEHCCCCIEPWESCDLSPFTLSTSIYPLAMIHPSWDWLIDWFAHDDQLVGITHLSFGNAITRSIKN